MTIGAKVIMATTTMRVGWSKPSQRETMGVMATMGMALADAASGISPRRSGVELREEHGA